MNRRQFMSQSSVAAVGYLLTPSILLAQSEVKKAAKPPQISADLVREFVVAGHGDLDKVKEFLGQQPNLLFACWIGAEEISKQRLREPDIWEGLISPNI